KMSSRKGRLVTLDELLDRAREKIEEMYGCERKLAEEIGKSAVAYAILRNDPNQHVDFDWNRVLRMKGDTGPYLQYAHTRCCGILRKAGRWRRNYKPEELNESEKELVRILSRFPRVVISAAKELRPNYICNYALELATSFDSFYESNPVLNAEDEKKEFRLTLVECVKIVLGNAMRLICMESPEKM
ncbi:MAG: DALR anticodon-binding domain-containing protein, partial [Candidatus Syntropharchaeia archaeon]